MWPSHVGQGWGIVSPLAVAPGTRSLQREKTAVLHDRAAPAAIGASLRRGTRRGAAAVAGSTLFVAVENDLLGAAAVGLLEVQAQVALDIGPTANAPSPTPSTEHIAESEHIAECAEDVANVAELGASASFERGMTELVVPGPFLFVVEDLEGLGGLLELPDRLLVTRIAVRVVLHRHFPVGVGNFLLGGSALNSEDFVVVSLGGHT